MPEERERSGVRERRLMALGILIIVGEVVFILVKIGLKLGEIALSVIALSAVGVSLWQGWIMREHEKTARKHARLSVKPWLEFVWADKDNVPESGQLTLANNGLGPAVVTRIQIAINDGCLDVLTQDKADEIWRDLRCTPAKSAIFSQEGTSMRAGKEIELLTGLPRLKRGSELRQLRATASFESMYGEAFPEVSTTFLSPAD